MRAFLFFFTVAIVLVGAYLYLNRGDDYGYNKAYCDAWNARISADDDYSLSYWERLQAVLHGCL